MSKDTYTYKEILLGLRDEFIDVESQLRELKDYSLANKKYVSKYTYYLSKVNPEHLPELRVSVVRKQTALMRKLRELARRYSYYSDPQTALMVKSNNGIYYPLAGKPFKLGVNPEYKEEFERLATELLNSRLANEMNFDEVYSTSFKERETIATRWFKPYLRLSRENKAVQMTYCPETDRVKFASGNIPLTPELLDEIMSIEFPKEEFTPYHQEIIESKKENRDIVLSKTDSPITFGEFQIIDYASNPKIYLREKKQRKK